MGGERRACPPSRDRGVTHHLAGILRESEGVRRKGQVRTPARAPRAFTRGEGCTSSSSPFSPSFALLRWQRGCPPVRPSRHGFLCDAYNGEGRRERREEVKVCMRACSPPLPTASPSYAATLRRTCVRAAAGKYRLSLKLPGRLAIDSRGGRVLAACACLVANASRGGQGGLLSRSSSLHPSFICFICEARDRRVSGIRDRIARNCI